MTDPDPVADLAAQLEELRGNVAAFKASSLHGTPALSVKASAGR